MGLQAVADGFNLVFDWRYPWWGGGGEMKIKSRMWFLNYLVGGEVTIGGVIL